MNTYYRILNEIASVFDMDQWDDQVNLFTDAIDRQLRPFVHHIRNNWKIYILENSSAHDFPQFDFYKERCYVNGEKVKLDDEGTTKNKWEDQETVDVIIEDLDQLGEDCEYMFYDCFSLKSVPLFDTSRMKNMEGIFARCKSLKSVPKFDTSSVTNISWMFIECKSLVSVPLFDTNSVTNMQDMFLECPSLSKETIQKWSSVYNFRTNKMK